jgi:hypothetical protein
VHLYLLRNRFNRPFPIVQNDIDKFANLDIPEGVVICEHDLETPIVKMAAKLKKS